VMEGYRPGSLCRLAISGCDSRPWSLHILRLAISGTPWLYPACYSYSWLAEMLNSRVDMSCKLRVDGWAAAAYQETSVVQEGNFLVHM
jgi:hypothetical protein